MAIALRQNSPSIGGFIIVAGEEVILSVKLNALINTMAFKPFLVPIGGNSLGGSHTALETALWMESF